MWQNKEGSTQQDWRKVQSHEDSKAPLEGRNVFFTMNEHF